MSTQQGCCLNGSIANFFHWLLLLHCIWCPITLTMHFISHVALKRWRLLKRAHVADCDCQILCVYPVFSFFSLSLHRCTTRDADPRGQEDLPFPADGGHAARHSVLPDPTVQTPLRAHQKWQVSRSQNVFLFFSRFYQSRELKSAGRQTRTDRGLHPPDETTSEQSMEQTKEQKHIAYCELLQFKSEF